MDLTDKQERFARAILDGLDQTAAYKAAGYSQDQQDKTIWEAASRLAANAKVIARIQELRDEAAAASKLTRAFVLQGLIQIAQGGKNEAARNRAFELLGKELGMFKDQTEHTFTNASDDDLQREANLLLAQLQTTGKAN